MNYIKKTIKKAAFFMVAGLGLSSCSMDLLPLNEVVLENYWKEGDDVQSVINSCYTAMQSKDYIQRLIVWGECRSDNTTPNSSADANLRNMMKGNLKTTNPWCDWGAFYTVINRCNTVLHYASEVAQKDPNFTESDYNIVKAEAKFMRAFSYLTLIKTFQNVPFVLEPSIDDTQFYRVGQTSFNEILTALINDIEECKNFPPIRYAANQRYYNTGRIARMAMYSLLAELYLWRASDASADVSSRQSDYRACISCCDYILNIKIAQFKENIYINDNDGQSIKLESVCDRDHVYTTYGIPLLKEADGSTPPSTGPLATNTIFGDGNSFESLYEITFVRNQDKNFGVGEMYGGYAEEKATSPVKLVLADPNIISTTPTAITFDNAKLFSVTSDFRSQAPFYYTDGSGSQSIYKYVLSQNMAASSSTSSTYGRLGNSVNSYEKPAIDQQELYLRSKEGQSENWILYRLSEIILFRAEAEIALAGTMTGDSDGSPATATAGFTGYHNGADLGSAGDLYADAFNLISAVYWRSNPSAINITSALLPKITNFTTYGDYMTLLMNERRREFLFEGKRYYDLVRQARRNGNTANFAAALTSKYGDASKAILIKMSNMDFMYMPVARSQMKVNPNLHQNSCYLDEEESVKN